MSGLGTFRLNGIAFNQFTALLSRVYRENDYLIGRLHAIDRLIDIVSDSTGAGLRTRFDLAALKNNDFLQIFDAQERHLPTCEMTAELCTALDAN